MTLNPETIAVRHKVWHASQRGWDLTLTNYEVKTLWSNLFNEAVELRELRESRDRIIDALDEVGALA